MTTIREAETESDALAILRIRNEVRGYMTRFRAEISPEQQLVWFAGRKENGISLYAIEVEKQIVGYGLLQISNHDNRMRHVEDAPGALYVDETIERVDDWRAALTGAMTEHLRGKGYGRLIFAFLLSEAWIKGAVPWLEVLESNVAALALYHKLGFRESARHANVITMLHAK
jgi:ribosomal protein S18 acetylase RimI-like enzyme